MQNIEEVNDLYNYIPIKMANQTSDYITALLDNMVANNDFYNNAVMNITQCYVFCIHSLLVKLYKNEDNVSLLKYLKNSGCYFNKDKDIEGNNVQHIEADNLNHYLFNKIERDAVRLLFHLLGVDKGSDIFQNNNIIFDCRNDMAHFNERIIRYDRFIEVINLISDNLKRLHEKAYKYTKEKIISEIKKTDIDEANYVIVVDTINLNHYVTTYDYMLLDSRLKSITPKTNYYIKKYASEILGLDSSG